jgi:RNA polymerase sigma-70 factor (ECF subfamily)
VGRGPLGGWVRVVAVRTAIDLSRRRGERRPQPEPALLADPELEYLRDRYREEFARAFAAAIAGLPPDSRNLLRLHLVEGISMEELGRQLGVHSTTVLRRVAAARRAIVEAAKEKLRERLRLSDSEYVSLFKIVRSQLEITIEPLLVSHHDGRDHVR